MELHQRPKLKGSKTKKKRLGRGIGSGKGGHTVGRGSKGQKARSKVPYGFEGGQVPLYKKIPKVGGFKSQKKYKVTEVTLDKLSILREGTKVNPQLLVEKGVFKRLPRGRIKVILKGNFKEKITLEGFEVSDGVKELVEKLGGKVL